MVVTIDSKFYSKLQLGISKYQEKTPADPLNAIADTNSAFSRCCPAPLAQLLFSDLIFLRRFGTTRYSMFLM